MGLPTPGNDYIVGDANSGNTINGLAGNDEILGGNVDDVLAGASGSDTLGGGNGSDVLFGGTDADFLYGGAASDRARGGTGHDALYGEDGNDTLDGEEGSDLLSGGAGDDELSDGFGAIFPDSAPIRFLSNWLFGGAGNDILNDTSLTDDYLVGGTGRDTVNGGQGNDTLIGSGYYQQNGIPGIADEIEVLFRNPSGAYYHFRDDERDVLNGGDGSDEILAGGRDVVSGDAGNDRITLYAVGGSARVDGGGGLDQFTISYLSGGQIAPVRLSGGRDTDFASISATDFTGDLVVRLNSGVVNIVALDFICRSVEWFSFRSGKGNDVIAGVDNTGPTALYDVLYGNDGNDRIDCFGGNDSAFGDAGDDRLDGGEGKDTLQGDNAASTAVGGNDVLIGGAGDDSLYGNGGNDILEGGAGRDLLDGGIGLDLASYGRAAGSVRVDLLLGEATGADGRDRLIGINGIVGSEFDDVLLGDDNLNTVNPNQLFGRGGNDRLEGRGGFDELDGGAGEDTLTGGSGGDNFVFRIGFGRDVVTDFDAGTGLTDRIWIVSSIVDSFAAVLQAANQVGANCVISIGAERITLRSVQEGDLVADDFVFF